MPRPIPPCRTTDRRSARRLVDPDRRRPRLRRQSAPPSQSTPAASSGTSVSIRAPGPTPRCSAGTPLVGLSPRCDAAAVYMPVSAARYEFYPHTGPNSYTGWDVNTGGVHIESGGVNLFNLGTVTLPQVGVNFGGYIGRTFRRRHRVVDRGRPTGGSPSTPSRSRRCIPIPRARFRGTARSSSARSPSTNSRGNRWTAGVGWPGRYILFVTDTATGREIQAYQDLGFGATPTIDLDAICFGFDNCAYLQGGPGTTSGTFHPTPPTRILDTRFGVGITNGPIRSGGGRIDTPDPNTRRDETANHELKVTGVGGVPEAGRLGRAAQRHGRRSAWPRLRGGDAEGGGLLRRTGDLRRPGIGPRRRACHVEPQRRRRRHRAEPRARPRRCRREDPHLQLVGTDPHGRRRRRLVRHRRYQRQRLRIRRRHAQPGSSTAATTSAPRAGAFAAGETRSVQVAGVAGVPTNATSVVVNITATARRRAPDSPPRSRPASRSRSPPTSTTSRARRAPTSPSSRSAPVGRSRSTRPRRRST